MELAPADSPENAAPAEIAMNSLRFTNAILTQAMEKTVAAWQTTSPPGRCIEEDGLEHVERRTRRVHLELFVTRCAGPHRLLLQFLYLPAIDARISEINL